MTIIECINEKTVLHLNPFQVFVFLNEKTKGFEHRIKRVADRQRTFRFVFIDDDPRSHIQTQLAETMDYQLYTLMMNADIVARVMPKWAGDYRYLTEIVPPCDDWSSIEKTVNYVIRKLRNELYYSKAIKFLEKINENLTLATKNPVMDYDEMNFSEGINPDLLE